MSKYRAVIVAAALVGLTSDEYISYRPRVGDKAGQVRDRFKNVPEHVQLARLEAAQAKRERRKEARLHRRPEKATPSDWRFR